MEIKKYQQEDAQKMAAHINGSDLAWPGSGLTHGVPFTAEFVKNWMEEVDWEIFLAWDQDDIAGFSSLTCIDGKKKTAYIPLLNVHPDFHGRGIGRSLLFKCVQRAIEEKYHRLDLHTWPSNRKAIPLYKKMGFFWNPETSVHMVNYLPLILQNPLVREYIDSREWYGFLQRSYNLSEDEETWEGIEVFNYRWTWDDEYLLVRVDRKSEKIANIEAPDFSISLFLERQINPLNQENSLFWKISKDREETPVFISFSGDDPFWPSGKMPIRAKEWKEEEEFKPAPELDMPPEGSKTSVLNAQVLWHNHQLDMGIGLDLNQVLKVSPPEELIEVKPGEKTEIWLNLENKLDRDLIGEAHFISSSHLEITVPETGIEISPGGKAGIRVFLQGKKKGVARLDMVLTYRFEEEYLQAIPWKGDVLVRSGGELTAREINNETWLVNDYLALKINGGKVEVFDKARKGAVMNIEMMQWGPPYNSSLFFQQNFQHRIEGEQVCIFLERSQPSRMRLTKKISLAGSEIYTEYELENLSDSRETIILSPQNSIAGADHEMVVIPLREGLLREVYDQQVFPGFADFSGPAELFDALWQAFETGNRVVGICLPSGKGEVEVWANDFLRQKQTQEIEGFSKKTFPGPAFYVGGGNWKKVAQLSEKLEWPNVGGPVKNIGEPEWDGKIPVIQDGKGSGIIKVAYPGRRKSLLNLDLKAPEGLEPQHDSAKVFLEERRGYGLQLDWKDVQVKSGIYCLQTSYRLRGWQKEKFLPVVVTSPEDNLTSRQDGSCWEIENGDLQFKIDPEFGGTIYSLQYRGQEILNSPHPEVDVMEWMYPWFGGIGPTLALQERSRYPGYLCKEKFNPRWVERKTPSGLNWQGLVLDIEPERKEFKGLELSLSYLTLPQIPVLAIKFTLKNKTRFSFGVNPRIILFPRTDFIPEGSVLKTGRKDVTRTRVLGEMEGAAGKLDWCSLQAKERMVLATGCEQGINFSEIPHPYQYIFSVAYPGLKTLGPREELSLKLFGFWGDGFKPGNFCHSLADEFNILEDN